MPANKGELGKVGQYRMSGTFFEEFLPELRGKKGIEVYKEMANNDEMVYAILFTIEMLMRNCPFTVQPGGSKPIDTEAAEFVEQCMNDMQDTWQDTLSEILSFIQYGWSYHEIVYKRRLGKTKNTRTSSKYDDGLIGWSKLPIRAQDTLYEWKYDENTDDLLGMVQAAPPNYEQVLIPVTKALHFTTKRVKANPEGKSILRGAYRPWYFKKRIQEIEGIGIERDLAGFPVMTAPADVDIWGDDPESAQVRANAETIVNDIRRDCMFGLVKPEGWTLELLASSSKRQFDTNQVIERWDKRIATTVLADFILLGQQAVGSFALSSTKTQLFAYAIGSFLNTICEVFNNQAIPALIDLNEGHFNGITDYPKMVHGDIEEPDLAELGTFINTMVGCGAIQPDEGLEDHLRKVAHLPERREDYDYGPVPTPAATPVKDKKDSDTEEPEVEEDEPEDPENTEIEEDTPEKKKDKDKV